MVYEEFISFLKTLVFDGVTNPWFLQNQDIIIGIFALVLLCTAFLLSYWIVLGVIRILKRCFFGDL